VHIAMLPSCLSRQRAEIKNTVKALLKFVEKESPISHIKLTFGIDRIA
jgi:hypothetical protein